MQAIPLPQVDSRHPRPPSSLVTLVIRLYGLDPKVTDTLFTFLTEADINEEVTELVVGLELWRRCLGRPSVNTTGEEARAVPAAEGAGTFGLVVERGT